MLVTIGSNILGVDFVARFISIATRIAPVGVYIEGIFFRRISVEVVVQTRIVSL